MDEDINIARAVRLKSFAIWDAYNTKSIAI